MFSKNQILKISGSINNDDLLYALEYVLNKFDLKNKNLAYQITDDGAYCLGWFSYDEPEIGWNAYTFSYNTDVMSLIIKDHIKNNIVKIDEFGDRVQEGFLIRSCADLKYTERETIKNDFYCIAIITPYTLYF